MGDFRLPPREVDENGTLLGFYAATIRCVTTLKNGVLMEIINLTYLGTVSTEEHSKMLKARIFNSNVTSVRLHWCETWEVTTQIKKQITNE